MLLELMWSILNFKRGVVHESIQSKNLEGVPTLVRRGEVGFHILSITHHVYDNCFSFAFLKIAK